MSITFDNSNTLTSKKQVEDCKNGIILDHLSVKNLIILICEFCSVIFIF